MTIVDPELARILWHRIETVNAVTYFSPECREGPAALGLKGFWMGYFACRAAPLGPVGPGVVEATFFNFHPDRVRRAIPDAWSIASPDEVLHLRSTAAASALRRLLGAEGAEQLASAVTPTLRSVIALANGAGRPLFAANREVPAPDDPVAALWQAATTVREHRGDSHVALLTGAVLDGCEVHVLFAAGEDAPAELYQQSRGWSEDDWGAAVGHLQGRGLLEADGSLADTGAALRSDIERRTDELAAGPYAGVDGPEIDRMLDVLGPAAARIAAAGDIRYPNPMGLPPADT